MFPVNHSTSRCDLNHMHKSRTLLVYGQQNRGGEEEDFDMSCRPSCMLAHDLANKLAAVVSHCDLLELEVSSVHQRAEKIRQLALQMADMLQTRECERKPCFSDGVENSETSLTV